MASFPDPSLDASSTFVQGAGLVVDEYGGDEVTGHIDAGPQHHTPWGMVHGGVYAAAIESACSIGASLAAEPAGQFAVGLSNQTDFLRAHREGRLDVRAGRSTKGGPASSGPVTSRARTASSSRRAACGCRTSRSPRRTLRSHVARAATAYAASPIASEAAMAGA